MLLTIAYNFKISCVWNSSIMMIYTGPTPSAQCWSSPTVLLEGGLTVLMLSGSMISSALNGLLCSFYFGMHLILYVFAFYSCTSVRTNFPHSLRHKCGGSKRKYLFCDLFHVSVISDMSYSEWPIRLINLPSSRPLFSPSMHSCQLKLIFWRYFLLKRGIGFF